jgi:hypothetical protein
MVAGATGIGAQSAKTIALDDTRINRLFSELRDDERRDLKGVRVVVDDKLRAEAYFNGMDAEQLHDIRSAGKSVTSLLAGVAIEKGLISSVWQPVVPTFGVTGHADKAGIALTLFRSSEWWLGSRLPPMVASMVSDGPRRSLRESWTPLVHRDARFETRARRNRGTVKVPFESPA